MLQEFFGSLRQQMLLKTSETKLQTAVLQNTRHLVTDKLIDLIENIIKPQSAPEHVILWHPKQQEGC